MNTQPPALPSATTVGPVTLAVADLDTQLKFYSRIIGLTVLEQSGQSAALGIDHQPLLHLLARPGGQAYPRSPGLFHLALLLPSRPLLAQWLRHLLENRYRLDGVGDHLVSEALYLSDPEGNGIEMYRDRSRESWEFEADGRLKMATLGIDVDNLLADAPNAPFGGLPAGTTMGHVHLQVSDVQQAIDFYQQGLGFGLMTTFPGAGFLSAGGYHHHLGVNVWRSGGAAPRPTEALGLESYTILLPDEAVRQTLLARLDTLGQPVESTPAGSVVADPAGNRAVLAVVSESGESG